MASNNILLDDFEMQFVYKFTDKFDNELYVFKVNKENDLKRIKKEIKLYAYRYTQLSWLKSHCSHY